MYLHKHALHWRNISSISYFGLDKTRLHAPQTLTVWFSFGTNCLYFKQLEQKLKPQFGQAFSLQNNPKLLSQVLQAIFLSSSLPVDSETVWWNQQKLKSQVYVSISRSWGHYNPFKFRLKTFLCNTKKFLAKLFHLVFCYDSSLSQTDISRLRI